MPFFFSGVVVSLALTRSPYPIGLVYGVDLAGAASGCLGVLAILDNTDGPSAVLWVSALVALAALFFAGSQIGVAPQMAPPFARFLSGRPLLFLILIGCAAANGLIERGLRPLSVKGSIELANTPKFERWNSFSRISESPTRHEPPQMWGPSPKFRNQDWLVDERQITIDGDAATITYRTDGTTKGLGFLKDDVTNLAYFLPDRNTAAVIGFRSQREPVLPATSTGPGSIQTAPVADRD